MRDILFDDLKLSPEAKGKGKSGASKSPKSTSEAVLQKLVTQHPLPSIVLEFRHCQKLLGTYVTGLEQWVRRDKIHCQWLHTGTATGRLASMNPNLQNLPRGGQSDSQVNIRDAFCSPEGFSLAAFDYSQLEMRILTHMSKDPILIDFFKQGQDIHK